MNDGCRVTLQPLFGVFVYLPTLFFVLLLLLLFSFSPIYFSVCASTRMNSYSFGTFFWTQFVLIVICCVCVVVVLAAPFAARFSSAGVRGAQIPFFFFTLSSFPVVLQPSLTRWLMLTSHLHDTCQKEKKKNDCWSCLLRLCPSCWICFFLSGVDSRIKKAHTALCARL